MTKRYANYFKDKKITVMGLGLLGRGLGDAQFLAECGADLIVTDLKSADILAPSLENLKKYKNIHFVLGEHRLEDFRDRDMILKAAGVPLDSPYIAEAKKNGIPVEMSASLFARLACPTEAGRRGAEGVTIVGVTGTRGKSTVTHLIGETLKKNGKRVVLGGNVKGISTLALLAKVKPGDIAVLELDSWQLQGFGEAGISPHIAVFTNFMPDHLNYYSGSMKAYFKDKSALFSHQKPGDVLIVSEEAAEQIKKQYRKDIVGKLVVVKESSAPKDLALPGEHNRLNAALALKAALALGISKEHALAVAKAFKGVPGRLERLKSLHGIDVYNDTTSTTPDAVIAGLRALSKGKNIVLIMGGADKQLKQSTLLKELPKHAKAIVLLPGTGTDTVREKIKKLKGLVVEEAMLLPEAVEKALALAKRGDHILFSPGFASFGLFKNEFDRGEQFIEIVKKLK